MILPVHLPLLSSLSEVRIMIKTIGESKAVRRGFDLKNFLLSNNKDKGDKVLEQN